MVGAVEGCRGSCWRGDPWIQEITERDLDQWPYMVADSRKKEKNSTRKDTTAPLTMQPTNRNTLKMTER